MNVERVQNEIGVVDLKFQIENKRKKNCNNSYIIRYKLKMYILCTFQRLKRTKKNRKNVQVYICFHGSIYIAMMFYRACFYFVKILSENCSYK